LYTEFIIIIRHSDDGHRSDGYMLVKNNIMCSKLLISGSLLIYHINIKHSLNARTYNTQSPSNTHSS